jgi:acetyltransferase-like isoleucine patch superfamily enzyme
MKQSEKLKVSITAEDKDQSSPDQDDSSIFDRMRAGEAIRLDDPQYPRVQEVVTRTLKLSVELNTSSKDVDQIRKRLSELIGREVDASTIVFVPFYTNFGRFIQIGKNVFVNHAFTFMARNGITIEDDVLIGPKVNLISENHPLELGNRKAVASYPIVVRRNKWRRAAGTILPGVSIGVGSRGRCCCDSGTTTKHRGGGCSCKSGKSTMM